MGKGDFLDERKERAVLAGVSSPALTEEENASEATLKELEELLKTAGGECVAKVLQVKDAPDAKTFFGHGKVEEIKEIVKNADADILVVDHQISPSQTRALEKTLECRVIDRATLILDIFAKRAKTAEGKLQVELAQYQYALPRLYGKGEALSQQTASGGKSPIGTRGPGETKLETDKRHIRNRISKLKQEISDIKRTRDTQRRQRKKSEKPLVAIVGYTNAGKSTLLNTLTGAGIEANDRLFDTLDPTIRLWHVNDTLDVYLSDTVGFIRKLPHHLVDAFKATLEEVTNADLILNVVDATNEEFGKQAAVVERVISDLGAEKVPQITVYNKIDQNPDEILPLREDAVPISAKYGGGIDKLKLAIDRALNRGRHRITVMIPYSEGAVIDLIHRDAAVKVSEYTDDGIRISMVCDGVMLEKLKKYLVQG